jgi:hypothetical protein
VDYNGQAYTTRCMNFILFRLYSCTSILHMNFIFTRTLHVNYAMGRAYTMYGLYSVRTSYVGVYTIYGLYFARTLQVDYVTGRQGLSYRVFSTHVCDNTHPLLRWAYILVIWNTVGRYQNVFSF